MCCGSLTSRRIILTKQSSVGTLKSVILVLNLFFQVETKEQRLRFADTSSLGSYANKEVISIGIVTSHKRHVIVCVNIFSHELHVFVGHCFHV